MTDDPAATVTADKPDRLRETLVAAALAVVLLAIGLRLAPLWSGQPDLGHGWIVGCFAVWWLVERWRDRPAPRAIQPAGSGWGWLTLPVVALVLLAPVRLLLTPYPYWPGLLWLWTVGLLGLALGGLALAGGRPWIRHFGFGGLLIATALPWPQLAQQAIIGPLRDAITIGAAEVLNLLGYPAVAHGTTLQVKGNWVGMDEACGGLRSLQLALALAVIVGEAAALRFGRRIIMVVLALAAAVITNFGRVLFLSWRAAHGAPAEDAVHDASGYAAYLVLALVLGTLAWRWHGTFHARGRENSTVVRDAIPPAPATAGCGRVGWPAQRWLAATALSCLALEILTVVWFGGQRQGWRPEWTVQLPEHAPYFTRTPLAASSREMLLPDHYDAGSWVGRDRLTRVVFYVEWRGGQAGGQVPFTHNPTVCFPYAGCRLERELGTIQVQMNGRHIPFHGYQFTRAGQAVMAYFTIWDADRQEELADLRSTGGWQAWWRARWHTVVVRRAQIRAQLLTVALLGDQAQINALDDDMIRAEIAAVLAEAAPPER